MLYIFFLKTVFFCMFSIFFFDLIMSYVNKFTKQQMQKEFYTSAYTRVLVINTFSFLSVMVNDKI